jgi:hypothetical protein
MGNLSKQFESNGKLDMTTVTCETPELKAILVALLSTSIQFTFYFLALKMHPNPHWSRWLYGITRVLFV